MTDKRTDGQTDRNDSVTSLADVGDKNRRQVLLLASCNWSVTFFFINMWGNIVWDPSWTVFMLYNINGFFSELGFS